MAEKQGYFDYIAQNPPTDPAAEEMQEAEQFQWEQEEQAAAEQQDRIRQTDRKKALAELISNNAPLFEILTEALYSFGDAVKDPAWATKQCSILNEKWSGILREQLELDAQRVTAQELEKARLKEISRLDKLLKEQTEIHKKTVSLKTELEKIQNGGEQLELKTE